MRKVLVSGLAVILFQLPVFAKTYSVTTSDLFTSATSFEIVPADNSIIVHNPQTIVNGRVARFLEPLHNANGSVICAAVEKKEFSQIYLGNERNARPVIVDGVDTNEMIIEISNDGKYNRAMYLDSSPILSIKCK